MYIVIYINLALSWHESYFDANVQYYAFTIAYYIYTVRVYLHNLKTVYQGKMKGHYGLDASMFYRWLLGIY